MYRPLSFCLLICLACTPEKTDPEDTNDTSVQDTDEDTDSGQDTSQAEDTGDTKSLSSFEAGQYRVSEFALATDSETGLDVDGDGEVDNKLVTVMDLAALVTGQPLSVEEINLTIAKATKAEAVILLTELSHSMNVLELDILLGQTDDFGNLSVDDSSYDKSGNVTSQMTGAFLDETSFDVSSDYVEFPFPVLIGADPVMIPLNIVSMEGTADVFENTGIMGGAIPVEAFVENVIGGLLPTGDDYDPADYLNMTREELMEFIWNFASEDNIADITLTDGSPAISAAVTFTATPAMW